MPLTSRASRCPDTMITVFSLESHSALRVPAFVWFGRVSAGAHGISRNGGFPVAAVSAAVAEHQRASNGAEINKLLVTFV